MAENNLDGIGRRLRAPGSQHANAEELLVELVRLVESSRLAPERSPARVETVSLHPLVEAPSNKPRVTRVVDVEPPRAPESDHSYGPTVSLAPHRTEIATPTPSATDSGVAAHASDAPLPPVRPAPKAAIKGGGVAQRSTPNSIYPPLQVNLPLTLLSPRLARPASALPRHRASHFGARSRPLYMTAAGGWSNRQRSKRGQTLLADLPDSAADLFWALQSGIVTSRVAPSRDISNSALWWGAASFTAAVRSANELTGVPSTENNTSPSIIPALAAAPPASTLRTIRPRSEPILSAVADPGETGRNTTPRRVPWCATREGGPDGLGGVGGLGGGLTIAASTGFWGVLLQPQSARSATAPPRNFRI